MKAGLYTEKEIQQIEWLDSNGFSYEFDFPSPGRCQLLIIHRNKVIFKKRASISGINAYGYEFIYEFSRKLTESKM